MLFNNKAKNKYKLKLSFEIVRIKVSYKLLFIILSNINIFIKINYGFN